MSLLTAANDRWYENMHATLREERGNYIVAGTSRAWEVE